MKIIKSLFSKIVTFFNNLFGRTKTTAAPAVVVKAPVVNPTPAPVVEQVVELEIEDHVAKACDAIYERILMLCKQHGYSHHEASYAHSIKALAALEQILDDMQEGRYGYEADDEMPEPTKGPKVKRMRNK